MTRLFGRHPQEKIVMKILIVGAVTLVSALSLGTLACTASNAQAVAPEGTTAIANWLADREAITDLMYSFANALDTRDAVAYQNNFTDDGVVIVHDPSDLNNIITLHKDDMPAALQASLWDVYTATQHIMTNTRITITGSTATARVYLHAIHVKNNNLSNHFDAGGWYDCSYLKTVSGWKLTRVEMTAVIWTGPSTAE